MGPRAITAPANARSRRTRDALLSAARAILEQAGFEALTMTAVADRAHVSRQAAYLHFASRTDLVGALFDYLADAEGLSESTRAVTDAKDGVTALDRWAAHLANYHPRLLAVDRALQQVWRHDPDAAIHRQRVCAAKLANCKRLARQLAERGELAAPWTITSATDMLYALISSDMIESLLVDRRWSQSRLAEHLSVLFRSTFLAAKPIPTGRTPVARR